MCGHMKRDDPISRRVIQYLAMQTCDVAMLVRDVKSGRIIVEPPDEQKWLVRTEAVSGSAGLPPSQNWVVTKAVNEQFFEEMDRHREWVFGFKDYYDIIVWDIDPGRTFYGLYNAVQDALMRAYRFVKGTDLYKPSETILRTITQDKKTSRTRDIKPSEKGKIESFWDHIHAPGTKFRYHNTGPGAPPSSSEMPNDWKYTDADRLEDEILFPWERISDIDGEASNASLEGRHKDDDRETILESQRRKVHTFESSGFDMMRFAFDLDTDEEFSDLEKSESGEEFESDDEWESDASADAKALRKAQTRSKIARIVEEHPMKYRGGPKKMQEHMSE